MVARKPPATPVVGWKSTMISIGIRPVRTSTKALMKGQCTWHARSLDTTAVSSSRFSRTGLSIRPTFWRGITDCSDNLSRCVRYYECRDEVYIGCSKGDADLDYKIFLQNGTFGTLIMQQYGLNASVCAENWTIHEPNVVCRDLGFNGGILLGNQIYWNQSVSHETRKDRFHCTENEKNLKNCTHYIGESCPDQLSHASLLCFHENGKSISFSLC
ncbi:LOXL2_3_4 [Acanthosepion pharaonis]|uniref:LOXL2_3_4 n=1 Tax=Acanthosepion pharaonis TaxID=158019 RepID=A0A812E3F3_ACAPH|nr:LOXL2_3_4 [Sepia pharaonis]